MKRWWFCCANHCIGTEITVCEYSSLCHPQMQVKAHAKKKPYVSMTQKLHYLLWAEAKLKLTKIFWGQTNWSIKLFFVNHEYDILQTKEERDHVACYQGSVQKSRSLKAWGALVPMELATCTYRKAPSILKDKYRFWNKCFHTDDIFFREVPAYFSNRMLNHILHLLQQHGLVVEESSCWTGLSAVQTFHNVIWRKRHRTFEQL